VAQANGYGTVPVPVVIRADQVTTVHLEGGASWPNNAALVGSNPVRLPDGKSQAGEPIQGSQPNPSCRNCSGADELELPELGA
jgi:hypothetical protein